MRQFAKLFGPPDDQILVILTNDNPVNKWEVRFHFMPRTTVHSVCHVSRKWANTEGGRNTARRYFAAVTEQTARGEVETIRTRLEMIGKPQ